MAERRSRRNPGLVVQRELSRAARRWQRVPVRMLLVTGLLVVFVIALASVDEVTDPIDAQRLGRNLFSASTLALILATGIVPGVLIVQAVQSEREGGTLDLLTLSGIRPTRVLWGLLASRGLRAFLLLAGLAPLLALIPTLGGVGVGQAVASLLGLIAIFATTTSVGGVLGLSARSMPVAVIAAVGWWVLTAIIVPLRLATVVRRLSREFPDHVFPTIYAFEDGVEWGMAVAVAPWAVTVLVAIFVAGWKFRRGTATGWDPRSKSWPGPRWGWIAHAALQIAGWGWLEWAYLDSYNGGGRILTDPSARWWASVLVVLLLTSASILYLRAMAWVLPRLNLSRKWLRVPVVGDAIVWRELLTNAQGGLSRAVAIASLAWCVIAVLLVVGTDSDELLLMWAMLAGAAALAMSVLLATSSVMEERRRRTLPLLVSTTLPAWRIVRGKLAAGLLRLLPLVLLAFALAFFAEPRLMGTPVYSPAWTGPDGLLAMPVLDNIPFVRGMAVISWSGGVWIAVLAATLWLSVQIRGRALASALPAAVAAVVLIGLPVCGIALYELRHRVPGLEGISMLVFPGPVFMRGRGLSGIPLAVLLSTMSWWTTGVLLLALATRAVRRVGTDRS